MYKHILSYVTILCLMSWACQVDKGTKIPPTDQASSHSKSNKATHTVATGFGMAPSVGTSIGVGVGVGIATQPKTAIKLSSVADSLKFLTQRYEEIRLLLAQDQLKKSTQAALKLSQNIKTQFSILLNSSSKAKAQLTLMRTAADSMYQSKTAHAQRKAFGEMSKAMISLLHTQKDLQKGWYVFRCPMAQGYPQWIQATETMANPYMGKKMLECGSKGTWSP